MATKVAVVTGSNKGIGFATVRSLAKQFDGTVYLTARNEELGMKAVQELKEQGVKVNYHQLDIDNMESIQRFASYIKQKYNGLDILINNAAIAYKSADPAPFSEQAENTIRINFTSTLNLCNALFPLLRPHARVVNVSSRVGVLKTCKSQELKNKMINPNASIDDIVQAMQHFVEAAKAQGLNQSISQSAYGMSKVGLNCLTRVQQRLFNNDTRADLVVNSCCPGYVATDMTSNKGHKTVEEGCETPVYLALLPINTNIKGEFVAEKNIIDFLNS